MAKTKTFDAIVTRADTEAGLATMIGRSIQESVHVAGMDMDDACLEAGKEFGEWITTITDSDIFKKNIKSILGSHNFNEEFFLDGFRAALERVVLH